MVAAVTIPIFAEHVPTALTGRADPEAALRALRREHEGLLVVTLGTHGALALDGHRAIRSPAFHVDAIDTTGAGDVFRAGFIHGQLSGWSLEPTLRFANAAAAVSCTRLGALAGVPASRRRGDAARGEARALPGGAATPSAVSPSVVV